MLTKDISYLTISDLHLGNPKVQTEDMLSHYNHFFNKFNNESIFCNLDIIIIAGDLFDRLLDFSSDDVRYIIIWLSRLADFCARNNIKLRVLEGTPFHDRNQSKIIDTIITIMSASENIDYKYINTIFIEYMEDYNMHILYVPDEATSNTDLTYKVVKSLMADKGLYEVDIAVMHGCFSYMLRGVPGHIQHHKESDYLDIVKYFITIGHFHSFSTYERIICQGSLDRIAHGEEDPKGGVICYIEKNGDYRFEFIENTEAKIFKTIELKSLDIDKSKDKLHKVLSKLPIDSFVRIKAVKEHPMFIGIDNIKNKYPQFNFSRLASDKVDKSYQLINIEPVVIDYVPIMITKNNIEGLLKTQIQSKYTLNNEQQKLLDNILESSHA